MAEKLETAIIRRLMKVGNACAPDLANEIENATPEEVADVADSLVEQGILDKVRDPRARYRLQEIYTLVESAPPAKMRAVG